MKAIRELWGYVTGRRPDSETVQPEVIVHDPGSHAPKNLDDPFLDPDVQSRMGSLIADSATKKP